MLTVCRLCLSNDASLPIFNGPVALRIMTCTGLEVESNDELPRLICHVCRLRLEEFHHFRKRCHAADRRLRCAKRLGRNNRCSTNVLLEGDEEDAINLQDVAQCTATACSESNSYWRQEAAKLIRIEIDAYKKELFGLCKQQVREEIEQQVRNEVGELFMAQAKKECRLNVLDGLFYEIESFFVRKRNAIVCEQANGSEGFISDSEAADLESVSTIVCQNEENPTEYINMEDDGVEVVVVPETPLLPEPMGSLNIIDKTVDLETPGPVIPVAMVEINMQNIQPSHLEEPRASSFLPNEAATAFPAKPTPVKPKSKHSFLASPTPTTPKRKRKHVCNKHEPRTPKRRSYKMAKQNDDCYRCRLRSPPKT